MDEVQISYPKMPSIQKIPVQTYNYSMVLLPRCFIYAQNGYSRAMAFKRAMVSSLGGVADSFAADLFLAGLFFSVPPMDVLSDGK
jgi:hypothetical protein